MPAIIQAPTFKLSLTTFKPLKRFGFTYRPPTTKLKLGVNERNGQKLFNEAQNHFARSPPINGTNTNSTTGHHFASHRYGLPRYSVICAKGGYFKRFTTHRPRCLRILRANYKRNERYDIRLSYSFRRHSYVDDAAGLDNI
jgi:hypothetical protein